MPLSAPGVCSCEKQDGIAYTCSVHYGDEPPTFNNVRTVGDLRKLLADLEAVGISDDMRLAIPDGGGKWANGFDTVEVADLIKYGSRRDGFVTLDAGDQMFANHKNIQAERFTALRFW